MKRRDYRLDCARATAVLMMLLQHVCIHLHSDVIEVNYISAFLIETIILITKSAVPLFVMITGSLLIQEDEYFTVKRSKKMVLNMLFVIISWNIINAIYRYLMGDGIKKALHVLVYGNYWYLYMLLALYLIMPLISMMVKDYKTTRIPIYFVIVTMIYELYLSFILIIPNTAAEYIIKLVEKFMLSIVTGYTGIVLLGFLIKHYYREFKKKEIRLGVIFICGVSFVLIAVLYLFSINTALTENKYNYSFFDEFSAVVIASIIFIVIMICGNDRPKSGNRWLEFIGTHSIGIYVVSNIILDLMKRYDITIERYNNTILGVTVCSMLFITSSVSVVYLLSKTPLKRII